MLTGLYISTVESRSRKGAETKARMIEAATSLFERQGYAATGIQQILQESGAPRGSFYFHFPGGKEDLAVAAVERHGDRFGELLRGAFAQASSTKEAAVWAIDALGTHFEGSACESGCPVMAVTFETATRSQTLRAASRAAFESWIGLASARLEQDGLAPEVARSKARALLAAIEGALVLCRAYGDRGPLDDIIAQVDGLLSP